MIAFYGHSGLRYLALLSGLLVIGYAAYGMARGRPHDTNMRVLATVFRWMMDLTALFGVGLLFSGVFNPAAGTHIVVMLLATAVAHIVPAVMKKRPQEERTLAPYLVATTISLGLLVFGLMAIGRPIVG